MTQSYRVAALETWAIASCYVAMQYFLRFVLLCKPSREHTGRATNSNFQNLSSLHVV